jgi:hypothetical protein
MFGGFVHRDVHAPRIVIRDKMSDSEPADLRTLVQILFTATLDHRAFPCMPTILS